MGDSATGATCGTTRAASPPAARTAAGGGFAGFVSRSTPTRSGRRWAVSTPRNGGLTLSSRAQQAAP
eukprot:12899857-Alexandrium_andersonii.AAC.1